jgi:hypothetical protein
MMAIIHLLLISIETITCGRHQIPVKPKPMVPNMQTAFANGRSFEETMGVQPASIASSASLGGIGPRMNRMFIFADTNNNLSQLE